MSVVQSITTSLEGKIMGVEKLHLLIGLLVAFLLYLAMNRKEKFGRGKRTARDLRNLRNEVKNLKNEITNLNRVINTAKLAKSRVQTQII